MRPLRIRRCRQGRQKGRRGAKIPLPIVWQKIQPPDQHRFRLPQNPGVGMGGIPPPPLRVPFGKNLGQGQQKRRNHRRLLAQEGLRRFGGAPGIRRPLRRSLDRRDLRFRGQGEQSRQRREGAPRHIEEQNRDSGRDRRERPRRRARMGLEAIGEKDFRNIPPPHNPRLQAHPRRGQFPFAFGFRTRIGKRGASNLGDDGVARFRKPDGQNQRGAFPIQSIPQKPRGIREGRPSGLVRPLLVHLVGPGEPHGEGGQVHRDGRFGQKKNQI